MANKGRLTTKKEAEEVIRRKEASRNIKDRRKKIIERINERMDATDDIKIRTSKDGRKFYQAAFEKAFGVHKTTVSFYYTYKEPIPIELLYQISKRTNCSLQYLCLESDAINFEYDTVIKNTGLSEVAITKLQAKREYDEKREREYHQLQELKANPTSDAFGDERPIKTADVVSAIIESDHLDGIIRTMEKMLDDQTEMFIALDDVTDDDKQAELLRRKEVTMQKNETTAISLAIYIRSILLDFVYKKAEEGRNKK